MIYILIWILFGVIGGILITIVEYQEGKVQEFTIIDIFIVLTCILVGGLILFIYAFSEFVEFYDVLYKIFNTPLFTIGKKK
jgi:hypothetical protein